MSPSREAKTRQIKTGHPRKVRSPTYTTFGRKKKYRKRLTSGSLLHNISHPSIFSRFLTQVPTLSSHLLHQEKASSSEVVDLGQPSNTNGKHTLNTGKDGTPSAHIAEDVIIEHTPTSKKSESQSKRKLRSRVTTPTTSTVVGVVTRGRARYARLQEQHFQKLNEIAKAKLEPQNFAVAPATILFVHTDHSYSLAREEKLISEIIQLLVDKDVEESHPPDDPKDCFEGLTDIGRVFCLCVLDDLAPQHIRSIDQLLAIPDEWKFEQVNVSGNTDNNIANVSNHCQCFHNCNQKNSIDETELNKLRSYIEKAIARHQQELASATIGVYYQDADSTQFDNTATMELGIGEIVCNMDFYNNEAGVFAGLDQDLAPTAVFSSDNDILMDFESVFFNIM